jgi:hypothetical protein
LGALVSKNQKSSGANQEDSEEFGESEGFVEEEVADEQD